MCGGRKGFFCVYFVCVCVFFLSLFFPPEMPVIIMKTVYTDYHRLSFDFKVM